MQFFLGVSYYLNAFCQDFTCSIRKIDKLRDEYVSKTAAAAATPPTDRIEFDRALKKEICEYVDFQAEIIE